jgi:hypothetical protein
MKEYKNNKLIDLASKSDMAVSLNSNMNNIWHYIRESGELVTKMFNRKVCHVAEWRTNTVTMWKGDLDNDDYFLIILSNGILSASCMEREMFMLMDIKKVAYIDQVAEIVETEDYTQKILLYEDLKTTLPKLMAKITFQEVMNLFMWDYVSSKVEIYEDILT